ncbi:hypothetical protein OSTOST_01275, partial [Ostertagia ostertagi]
MSNLLEANAGGQREMAMKMAMAELDKKDKKKDKSHRLPITPTIVEVEDAKELTSATVINHHAPNSVQQPTTANGMPTAIREIESIPGTVQPHVGETPILDKVGTPGIAVQSSSPDAKASEGRDILAMKSASQHSLVIPEITNTTSTAPTPSIISSPPIMQEISPPASTPTPTAAPPTQSRPPSASQSSQPTITQNPSATPPPPPPPPPPTFPAAVEVHRNNDSAE